MNGLENQIAAFLIDRRARGLSEGTLRFYNQKLMLLRHYLGPQGTTCASEITPSVIRAFLLDLGEDHTPGGVHAAYRTLRAFLNWWGEEEAPDGWKNPIERVQAPRVPVAPLEPAPTEDIQAMLGTCRRKSFTGVRDKAVILCLFDSGCRAREFLDVNIGDIDLGTGQILIRKGKGGKARTVFVGAKSQRALAAYLRGLPERSDSAPLWVTSEGQRLSYSGLRDILRRRAKGAGVPAPTLHSFRRAFALSCLRQGMDIFSLQRLMGHSDLTVLRCYLAQTTEDLRDAYERSGPVDHLL